ncbi:IS256 family transposase [Mycoplasma sp. 6243]|uniref:IS256 family transposase n=1 Tax=Mycoplasma sp. 6243 TaxID=3440865 RepID=UPI003EBC7BCF
MTDIISKNLLISEKINEIKENGFKFVAEFSRDIITNIMNAILKEEFDENLKFEFENSKYEKKNTRNGYYTRTTRYTYWKKALLNVPRDRAGRIKSKLFTRYSRRSDDLTQMIMSFCKLGGSYKEITDFIENSTDIKMSRQTISNIFTTTKEKVDEFQNRKLPKKFQAIFLDSTYFSIKRGSYAKEVYKYRYGNWRKNGYKQVLNFEICPNENKGIFRELLLKIKEQGVEEVEIFVFDGLPGLENVVNEIFPKSKTQRCLVHIQRNIVSKVRVSDRKEISNDFMLIAKRSNIIEAQKELENFVSKWTIKGYKKKSHIFCKCKNLLTFFDFPPEKRKSIYTTNPIRSLNSRYEIDFKKRKVSFPNTESLSLLLAHIFDNWNIDRSFRATNGFRKYWLNFDLVLKNLQNIKQKNKRLLLFALFCGFFKKKFLNFSDKMLLYILLTFL